MYLPIAAKIPKAAAAPPRGNVATAPTKRLNARHLVTAALDCHAVAESVPVAGAKTPNAKSLPIAALD